MVVENGDDSDRDEGGTACNSLVKLLVSICQHGKSQKYPGESCESVFTRTISKSVFESIQFNPNNVFNLVC